MIEDDVRAVLDAMRRPPFNLDDEGIAWVEQTLAALDEDEKVGQLFCNVLVSFDRAALSSRSRSASPAVSCTSRRRRSSHRGSGAPGAQRSAADRREPRRAATASSRGVGFIADRGGRDATSRWPHDSDMSVPRAPPSGQLGIAPSTSTTTSQPDHGPAPSALTRAGARHGRRLRRGSAVTALRHHQALPGRRRDERDSTA